eukprot:498237_1
MMDALCFSIGDEVVCNTDPEDDDKALHVHLGHIIDIEKKRKQISIQLNEDNQTYTYFMDEIVISNAFDENQKSKVDFESFKQTYNENECVKNDDNPLETCNSIKRLVNGLQYYSSLNLDNERSGKEKDNFNKFIHEIYIAFLDDYIHLIKIHGDKLEKIHDSLLLTS